MRSVPWIFLYIHLYPCQLKYFFWLFKLGSSFVGFAIRSKLHVRFYCTFNCCGVIYVFYGLCVFYRYFDMSFISNIFRIFCVLPCCFVVSLLCAATGSYGLLYLHCVLLRVVFGICFLRSNLYYSAIFFCCMCVTRTLVYFSLQCGWGQDFFAQCSKWSPVPLMRGKQKY